MTDTKPKDVWWYCRLWTRACGYICVCAFTKVPESVRVCRFSCDSMTREPSPAFSAESLDLILGCRIGCVPCHDSGCAVPAMDRDVKCHGSGCEVPRIGMWCATDRDVKCHGSGRAVPAVTFTTGPDTRRIVKNRVHPSSTWAMQCFNTMFDYCCVFL